MKAPEGSVKNRKEFEDLIGQRLYAVYPCQNPWSWKITSSELIQVKNIGNDTYSILFNFEGVSKDWWLINGTGKAPYAFPNGRRAAYFFTNYWLAYAYWCQARNMEENMEES